MVCDTGPDGGQEEGIVLQCRKKSRSSRKRLACERCFIPYYEQKRRYEGAWHIEKSAVPVMSS